MELHTKTSFEISHNWIFDVKFHKHGLETMSKVYT